MSLEIDPPPQKQSIELSLGQRLGACLLGLAFIALPVAAYFDSRMGLLGAEGSPSTDFNLVFAIFAVIGGVFLLSGAIGYWVMWKDVQVFNPRGPAVADIDSTEAPTAENGHRALSPASDTPPFDGTFVEKSLDSADPAFVTAAENYYRTTMGQTGSFPDAVRAVYRTASGRPNWYFLVDVDGARRKWIRVPHAGRAGTGAGQPGVGA